MRPYNKTEYLAGLVIVETLGIIPDSFGRFRNGDDRGEVAMIVSGSTIQYVEFAEFRSKGVKRGYHYHERYLERLYVLQGKILMAIRPLDRGSQTDITLSSGDIVTIYPGVAHAFFSKEPSLVLSMGSEDNPFTDRHLVTDFVFTEANDEADSKTE